MEEKQLEAITIQFENSQDTNTLIIRLKGYIDSYNAREFQASLLDKLESDHHQLIINASGLEYISSAGIGAFMALSKEIDDLDDGRLILCNLTKKVVEVFELLGFLSLFEVVRDESEALEAIGGSNGAESGTGAEEAIADIIFPLIFGCPNCGKKLKVNKPGKYRCSGCSSILTVNESGEVSAQQ